MSRQPDGLAARGRGAGIDVPRYDTYQRFRRRAVLVGVLLAGIAGLFGWRLATLQLLDPDRFVAHGEMQRIKTVALQAARGAIVDRNGVDLVLSVPRTSVWANPLQVEDPVRAARTLSGILDADVSLLEERLSRDSQFVWLGRQVSDEVAAATLRLGVTGVYFDEERARVRPGGDSALAVLGRTDIDAKGISGMELVYDSLLSGTDGEKIVERGLRRIHPGWRVFGGASHPRTNPGPDPGSGPPV